MFKDRFRNKTILIVEDDVFSSKLLSEYLSLTGAKILFAKNGFEAVNYAKNNSDIDLILMDIKLPGKGGIDATKEIRYFRKNVPIIAQTATAMLCELKTFYFCGMDDYITKPYTQEELLQKVDRHLRKKYHSTS
ncbi:MAG: response regulator [Bacteroidales bacterium]|nr:response regulator [Bacteroidales bacterium]